MGATPSAGYKPIGDLGQGTSNEHASLSQAAPANVIRARGAFSIELFDEPEDDAPESTGSTPRMVNVRPARSEPSKIDTAAPRIGSQNTGMAAGVKPRSREAVRQPGRMRPNQSFS
jgi:hypothetical protein